MKIQYIIIISCMALIFYYIGHPWPWYSVLVQRNDVQIGLTLLRDTVRFGHSCWNKMSDKTVTMQQKQQVPNNDIIMSPREVWVVWREILLRVV